MKRLVYFLMVLFLLAVAGAEAQKTRPVKKRPARKAAQDKRVYLVHADVLHFDQFKNRCILPMSVLVFIATVPISTRPAIRLRLSVM